MTDALSPPAAPETLYLNGRAYALSALPAPTRRLALEWHAAGQAIARLERQLAIHQTARECYAAAVRRLLKPYRVRLFWLRWEVASAAEWQRQRAAWLALPPGGEWAPGDQLLVYARGHGALGWAVVEAEGRARWQVAAMRLSHALRAGEVRCLSGLTYPTRPWVALEAEAGRTLREALSARLPAAPPVS